VAKEKPVEAAQSAGLDVKKNETIFYKGFPLRRKDDFLYYGRVADGYIVQLQILKSEEKQGLNIPTLVSVQLQNTAPGVTPKDVIVRDAKRTSLFEAVDLAEIWLSKQVAAR